ncbi:hypothetical protein B0H11DRAFT_1924087 [Mycena galericulata]|nr:hypothetical protein B0H11DRAFT_1924087 [Mycena galericulata]
MSVPPAKPLHLPRLAPHLFPQNHPRRRNRKSMSNSAHSKSSSSSSKLVDRADAQGVEGSGGEMAESQPVENRDHLLITEENTRLKTIVKELSKDLAHMQENHMAQVREFAALIRAAEEKNLRLEVQIELLSIKQSEVNATGKQENALLPLPSIKPTGEQPPIEPADGSTTADALG